MEATYGRTAALTAIAPIAWGSTYFVTQRFLPAEIPLTGAAIRALPAGVLLLALRPALPRGDWWWRAAVISLLTAGGFFVLVYIVGQLLPSGLASIIMATSALAMLAFAWVLLGQRPSGRAVAGGLAGVAGVALLVSAAAEGVNGWGVLASVLAMVSACLGYVLTAKWRPPVSPITFAGWQLTMGGLMLIPVALAVEGPPPALDRTEVLAFGYLTFVATGLAYVVWFQGIASLGPGAVGLIGLLNPLAGTLLGVGLAGERFTVAQVAGAALILAGVLAGLRPAPPPRPART